MLNLQEAEKRAITLSSISILIILTIPMSKLTIDTILSIITIGLILFIIKPTSKYKLVYFIAFTSFIISVNMSIVREILSNSNHSFEDIGFVIEKIGFFITNEYIVIGSIVLVLSTFINFAIISRGIRTITSAYAKFSINTLPGKQMAIDSDLSNNIIDNNEAKLRKKKLLDELSSIGTLNSFSIFFKVMMIVNTFILILGVIAAILIDKTTVPMLVSNGIVFQIILVFLIIIFMRINNTSSIIKKDDGE